MFGWMEESLVEEVKWEDVRVDVNREKSVVEVEVLKDEEKKVVVVVKKDVVVLERSVEVLGVLDEVKSRVEGGDVLEGRE